MDFKFKMDHTETQLLYQFCDIVSVKISFFSVAISSETLRQVKTLYLKEKKTNKKKSSKTYKAHTRIPTLPSFRSNTPQSYVPPDALLSAFEHACYVYTCI